MRCAICKKSEEETTLHDGIFESTIGKVCDICAERENIPLLRKPTQEQLAVADKRYSVRERMENLSNPYSAKPSDLSKDQSVAHKNLNKLRLLPKKQLNDKLYENYYWRLTLARRRRKMSKTQLAKISGVPEEIIDSIEKGILPANFEEPIVKLEIELGVNLLRDHETNIKFNRINHNEEYDILKQVGEKIGVTPTFHKENEQEEYMEEIDIEDSENNKDSVLKSEKLSKLSHGELDMSKRDNLQDITLSDLQNMKKQREEKDREDKLQKQHEDLFGEDVDFEDLESV
tara:strand:+ start:2218 stop:3081 length:864 start_codon:yes stop_codon:yes gene_type:complete